MKYLLGSLIGKGSDGEVYNLIDESKKERIIKFVQPTEYGFENYIEAYILLNLKHSNLMFAYDIEIEDDNGLTKIVQDKALCDLGQMLYKRKNKINRITRFKYIKELVSAVAFLHSYNIVHGDIKPANLLILNNKILVNDFSFSRLVKMDFMDVMYLSNKGYNTFNDRGKTNRKLYTFIYRPPECNVNKFSLKSDIFALGCTIYEILYNQPYHSISGDNRLYHIHSSSFYDDENIEINELLKNMVNKDPFLRVGIDTVCKFFDIEIPKKKILNLCLSYNKNNKVFSNKIEHTVGKIKMSTIEKMEEKKLFQSRLKIFTIENVKK
jgi:serine/threonine protein kinase